MKTSLATWPTRAATLAALIPHEALHPGAMETAWQLVQREKKRGGADRSAGWAVAFSGGADSLALCLLLWAHGAGRWGRKFVVLHFNHRLRGRAADADERFCAKVCAELGVKFVAGRWRAAPKGASEAEARTARMEFFGREMKKRKIRLLWLGHQLDDIAESMLMRLARGSGTAGLAAPRPAQALPEGRWHLRPLLNFKKAEIITALRAVGASWREDASNAGEDFFRNRIRRSVLPAWQRAAIGRDALTGAALARERLEEDDVALEAWVDALAPLREAGRELDVEALAGRPRAIVRRALHRWLLAQVDAGDLSRPGFSALLAAVESGEPKRLSLGRAGFAVIRRGRLRFEYIRPQKKQRRAAN